MRKIGYRKCHNYRKCYNCFNFLHTNFFCLNNEINCSRYLLFLDIALFDIQNMILEATK